MLTDDIVININMLTDDIAICDALLISGVELEILQPVRRLWRAEMTFVSQINEL